MAEFAPIPMAKEAKISEVDSTFFRNIRQA
jgi:hypothetical protein